MDSHRVYQFFFSQFILQMTEYDDDESVRVVLEVRYAVDDPSRDCLAVIGSAKSLGCWESNSAAVANYIGLSTWQCAVRLPKYQTTYWKWILMNAKSKQVSGVNSQ